LTNTQSELGNSGLVSIDRSIKHEQVYIEGIEVLFPYQPYEPQIAYMRSVIQALNKGENGLLQSPTGTGKTLCLLCATLAWMYHHQSESRIFYASRTHSQLQQVFEQLKKTCYRPVTTILASRNHSCVKYKNEFTGPKLTSVCQVATGAKEKSKKTDIIIPPCEYYKNFQTSKTGFFSFNNH